MPGQEGEEIVAADRLDRGRGAQHRTAERLARECGLLELVEDHVVGRVERLADLLQDDAALALQLVGIEHRVAQDVGHHLDAERHVLLQHRGVVGGDLAAGIGVEAAADILDLLGDGACRAGPGALEGHVLQHVRHAVELGGLVPRTAGDPDAERRRLDLRHLVDRDAQAVRQGGDLDLAHVRTRGRGVAAAMRSSISCLSAATSLGMPSTRSVRCVTAGSRSSGPRWSPVFRRSCAPGSSGRPASSAATATLAPKITESFTQ